MVEQTKVDIGFAVITIAWIPFIIGLLAGWFLGDYGYMVKIILAILPFFYDIPRGIQVKLK